MKVQEILRRPYSRVLIPDESELFAAELLEFPGCYADGETPDDAYRNLEEVAEAWVESALAQGYPIPEPFAFNESSGVLSLRLPRSLHKRAMEYAQRDGVSLNTFLVAAVGVSVGAELLAARAIVLVGSAIGRLEKARTNETRFFAGTIGASAVPEEHYTWSAAGHEVVIMDASRLTTLQAPGRVEVGA